MKFQISKVSKVSRTFMITFNTVLIGMKFILNKYVDRFVYISPVLSEIEHTVYIGIHS